MNTSAPKKLLDQYRDQIRLKQYSPRTEKTYVHLVKAYIFYHLFQENVTRYGGIKILKRNYSAESPASVARFVGWLLTL